MSTDSSRWEGLIRASSGDVRRLSAVNRFSSIPVCVFENVAEHHYWVAVYGAMIHRSLSPDLQLLGAVVLGAIVHDVYECVTGDVVRVFKYATPELKAEVDRAEGILAERLPAKVKDLIEIAEHPGVRGSPSSVPAQYVKAVIKAADFMSLFQYMRREAARGNLEAIPFYNRMVSDLEEMARKPSDVAVNADVEEARFPASFYEALHAEALAVRSDCFHGLEEDPRWTRPV